MRLLLVEDDPTTLRMLERLFSNQGYLVTTCSDGESALERHAADPFPFLVLDLSLPGIDGLEVCRRLRSRSGGDEVYILVITADTDSQQLQGTLSAGADDYLVKPITLELLRVRLAVADRHITEIRRRMEVEEENLVAKSEISDIVRSIPDMFFVIDREGKVRRCNQRVRDLLGFTPAEMIGHEADLLFEDTFLDSFPRHFSPWNEPFHNLEINLSTRDGEVIPVLISGSPLEATREGKHGGVVCIAKDISERIDAEERIRTLAFYDGLTGLPNRHFMQERIQAAMSAAERHGHSLALLFLDLDRFKQVNDTLGHQIGDQLLRDVSARLVESVRLTDTVARSGSTAQSGTVSRFGGDEFTILLTNIDSANGAALVADRIIASLEEPFEVEGHELYSGASLGIALFPGDARDAAELLRCADTAMYDAKNQGRSRFRFYTEGMNEAAGRRHRIENGLRRALEREEFQIHFQPLCRASDGQLTGAEVLIRWKLSGGENISPAEFIPIAEEMGLISSIGEWVLQSACAQAARWNAEGYEPIRIAINLSTRQLRDEGLAEMVTGCLRENHLVASQLELEITETAMMDDDESSIATLRALVDEGIGLSLDDFGTGYSSLSHIRRFPIGRVKIDRSFVSTIDGNAEDTVFTAAIIAMAHTMGLSVVAEGVETRSQAGILAGQGCDELQGYLFSRPCSAEEFEAFLVPEKPDPPSSTRVLTVKE